MAAAEVTRFKVGISEPVNTVLAMWMAEAGGFYAAQGLDVEIINQNGGSRGAQELQSGRIDAMHVARRARDELTWITQYVYFSYEGTLKRWQEYLAQASVRPELMRSLELQIGYGKGIGEYYQEAVHLGKIVVGVELDGDDNDPRLATAERILREAGAITPKQEDRS